MKDPFAPGPDDRRLAELVAGALPSDLDEAADLYGKLAIGDRPILIGIVTRFGVSCPEALVDEVIANGLERILDVFNGTAAENAFKYVGPMSLVSWLSLLIGKPEKPANGGLIHKYLRAERRRDARETSMDDALVSVATDDPEDAGDRVVELTEHLARLEPMERFVVDAFYGLSPELDYSPQGLRVRCSVAGLTRREAGAVVVRARRAQIVSSRTNLTQEEIATLLDTNVKAIGRVLACARAKLRACFDEAA